MVVEEIEHNMTTALEANFAAVLVRKHSAPALQGVFPVLGTM